MSRLAIVIPLFDKAAFIDETIGSIVAQDAPPDTLIIVDDASTDGSAAVARQSLARHGARLRGTRVDFVCHAVNAGPGAARNSGIARADDELLLCLDADDRLRPDALRRLRAAMDRHRLGMAVIGFDSDPAGEVFPGPAIIADHAAARDQADDDGLFLLADPLRAVADPAFFMGRASNVVVRRRQIGAHLYADARLNEGVDFWYRVLRGIVAAEGRVGLVAAPLIRFRISSDSLSHRPCADWRMLEVPPTVLRYRDGADPDDRRMAAMLAARWRDHALTILTEAQGRQFLDHHHALLKATGA